MLNGFSYHGTVYAAWTENGKVRIKAYDEGADTWTWADNGSINYDVSQASSGITFQEYHGKLYMTWNEHHDTAEQVRVRIYQN